MLVVWAGRLDIEEGYGVETIIIKQLGTSLFAILLVESINLFSYLDLRSAIAHIPFISTQGTETQGAV